MVLVAMIDSKSRFTCLLLLSVSFSSGMAIHGGVVDDHSGLGLASSEVRVTRVEDSTLVADIETDSDGRFELPNLSSAAYRFDISKPSYVPTTLTKRLGSANSKILIVRVIRCGSISGRVVDADDQPILSANVFVLSRFKDGKSLLPFAPSVPGHHVSVNQRGEYRLFNLPPGQYAVATTYGKSSTIVASGGEDASVAVGSGSISYPLNNPPRLFDIRDGGEEYRNVDFVVHPDRLVQVAGKIELTAPMAGFWLTLAEEHQPTLATSMTRAQDDGSFHFEGIPPGRYSLLVVGPSFRRGPQGIATDDESEFGRISLSVDEDLDRVSIAVRKGRTVSFTLRNADSEAQSCGPIMEIAVTPLEDWGANLYRTTSVNISRPVRLGPLAPTRYSLTTSDPESECYITGDRVLDLTNSGDQQAATIFQAHKGSILGRVESSPEDANQWAVVLRSSIAEDNDRRIRVVFPDSDGKFRFEHLSPGHYQVRIHAADNVNERWGTASKDSLEVEVKAGTASRVELHP